MALTTDDLSATALMVSCVHAAPELFPCHPQCDKEPVKVTDPGFPLFALD